MRLRLAALIALALSVLVVLGPLASTASASSLSSAAGEDALSFVGTLKDTRNDPPSPVAGVTLTLADATGEVVASTESTEDGSFDLPIPGGAVKALGETYTITLDESTLPEDSVLTDDGDVSRSVEIQLDQDITINYAIGPDLFAEDPVWEQAVQSLVSGLVLGLLLALASLGLSLVFGTTGLTNFAHGDLISFGAIVAYLLNTNGGMHILVAGPLAVLLSVGFGWVQDRGLWRPLRKRKTGLIAMMIVSIGLGIFLRNVYQYLVGADSHNYEQYSTVTPWTIGPVDLTPKDLASAVICIVVLLAVSLAVQKTRLGKATRAVSDNPALAASSGINVDRVITVVWMFGTGLAGLAGILFGLTQGFDYQVGFKLLLLVFASVTLGGLGTIWGAMAGSIVVGLLIEESTLILPAELKYASALVVLILVLLVRPQGILGRRERIG